MAYGSASVKNTTIHASDLRGFGPTFLSIGDRTMTTLATPSKDALADIWNVTACIPRLPDRKYHAQNMLYAELGLDWRNPDHKAHVERIVDGVAGAPQRYAMTND